MSLEVKFKVELPDGKWHPYTFDEIVQNTAKHGNTAFCTFRRRLWTGLKDKNGVEIYEGDYLHAPTSKLVLEVKWLDGAFCLVPVHTHDKELAERWGFGKDRLNVLPLHTMMCASKEGIGNMEVIGNIYENPELLETHP